MTASRPAQAICLHTHRRRLRAYRARRFMADLATLTLAHLAALGALWWAAHVAGWGW